VFVILLIIYEESWSWHLFSSGSSRTSWILHRNECCELHIGESCLPLDPQEQDHLVHVAVIVDWTVDPCVNNKVTTSVSTLLKPVSLATAAHWCCKLLFSHVPQISWAKWDIVFVLLGLVTGEVVFIGWEKGDFFCNFYPCSVLLVHGEVGYEPFS